MPRKAAVPVSACPLTAPVVVWTVQKSPGAGERCAAPACPAPSFFSAPPAFAGAFFAPPATDSAIALVHLSGRAGQEEQLCRTDGVDLGRVHGLVGGVDAGLRLSQAVEGQLRTRVGSKQLIGQRDRTAGGDLRDLHVLLASSRGVGVPQCASQAL